MWAWTENNFQIERPKNFIHQSKNLQYTLDHGQWWNSYKSWTKNILDHLCDASVYNMWAFSCYIRYKNEKRTNNGISSLLSNFYLWELIGDLWRVGVLAGFLFQRNNHKILKEFSLLPLNKLQLQCAVARGPSKNRLQFQQPLSVS